MSASFNLINGTKIFVPQNYLYSSIKSGLTSLAIDKEKPHGDYKPVEEIDEGDFLFGLNNQKHQVIHCSSYLYDGPIISIQHSLSEIPDHIQPNSLFLIKRRVQSMSEFGGWSNIPKGHFQRARELRNQMTPPEWQLWQHLSNKQMGVKFRPQHPIGPYITDFYSRKALLVIEIDGRIAHSTPEQIMNDKNRDSWLNSLGLKVIRYSAHDIFTNLDGVLEDIYYQIKECTADEFPQAQWLFSQNITLDDDMYISDQHELSQVTQITKTRRTSQWHKISLINSGSIITHSLILHT